MRRTPRPRTAPITIDVAGQDEAAALAGALGARGLPAQPEHRRRRWQLVVSQPREEPARLVAEVSAALEAWFGGRERITARIRLGAVPAGHRRRSVTRRAAV